MRHFRAFPCPEKAELVPSRATELAWVEQAEENGSDLKILDGSLVPLNSQKSLFFWRILDWLSRALKALAVTVVH